MRERNPWFRVLIAICILALAQLACSEDPPDPGDLVQLPAAIRGGGWIGVDNGKATFGFQLACDAETGQLSGQFQYNDHVERVAFHGVFDSEIEDCKVEVPESSLEGATPFPFTGQYTAQPPTSADPGTLKLAFDADSCLTVTLEGGTHGGYSRTGCPQGGNIKFWLLP